MSRFTNCNVCVDIIDWNGCVSADGADGGGNSCFLLFFG